MEANEDTKVVRCYVNCRRTFESKAELNLHLVSCTLKTPKCHICKLSFSNKGNLSMHYMYKCGKQQYTEEKQKHIEQKQKQVEQKQKHVEEKPNFDCSACGKKISNFGAMIKHVRSLYFNYDNKEPYVYKSKEIDDVWVEKVINTEQNVLIKKIKPNVLTITKCNEKGECMKKKDSMESVNIKKSVSSRLNVFVNKVKKNTLTIAKGDILKKKDSVQPTISKKKTIVKCPICRKKMFKASLRKHRNDVHNKRMCEKCGYNTTYLYMFLKHSCEQRAEQDTLESNISAE